MTVAPQRTVPAPSNCNPFQRELWKKPVATKSAKCCHAMEGHLLSEAGPCRIQQKGPTRPFGRLDRLDPARGPMVAAIVNVFAVQQAEALSATWAATA